MPKLDNETDLEYKQRIIDTKSASFCGAKWYNATIWLGSGMTTSCHHPLPHKVSVEEVMKNPKALHNTKEKKEQRRLMQAGERPKGCEYCWKIEDIGTNKISDRVDKTRIYSDADLQTAFENMNTCLRVGPGMPVVSTSASCGIRKRQQHPCPSQQIIISHA